MVEEAKLLNGENGQHPGGPGWFVVNVRDAPAFANDAFGATVVFESPEASFEELGINIRVLQPGKPNCLYHGENNQEDLLVLSGECLLLVEGQERPLRAWDFVHLPAWTEHVVVGAGDGPAVVLMVGRRRDDEELRYPVSELAARHGASSEEDTSDPEKAYARFDRHRPVRVDDERLPWNR
jgi:uncharacterized cupin superfamily protein